jgi:glycerol-3-phosphate acyltransferase PlsY
VTQFITAALIGYSIGSMPTGYWIGRVLKGIDIRNYGSGNLGATNVFRVLGWKAGAVTLAVDIAKGYLAVRTIFYWHAQFVWRLSYSSVYPFAPLSLPPSPEMLSWVSGICAILGHSFSPFVNFRGGKGAATGTGVFLALLPMETGIALAVFSLVLAASRIVSLSSIVGSLTLVIATVVMTRDVSQSAGTILAAGFVILRHRSNILRLMNGTESRLTFTSSPAGSSGGSTNPKSEIDSRLRPRE